MTWMLTIVFLAPGTAPQNIQVQTYPTQQACQAAGKAWQSPAVDQAKAITGFTCTRKKWLRERT